MEPSIIVHGGAGDWDLESERLKIAIEACREAAVLGHKLLQAGNSALDAVEQVVHILEDCPALDAGRGSYLNANGEIEMDALIMDGRSLESGAVAAIQRVRHPITLARHIMTDTAHSFLVGAGANAFADSIQFPRCTPEELLVGEELEKFQSSGPLGDTVGAVAIDSNGNIASATSTGGTRNKMPGRVGDSPLIGSGGYADNNTAGVGATGQGEALMKIIISKQVCDYVAQGQDALEACRSAIDLLARRTNGEGGLIAVDYQGRIGYAYNTTGMPYAYFEQGGELKYGR